MQHNSATLWCLYQHVSQGLYDHKDSKRGEQLSDATIIIAQNSLFLSCFIVVSVNWVKGIIT